MSVAVTVCVPEVLRTTPKVCFPASAAVNVYLPELRPVKTAVASLEVRDTVPVYELEEAWTSKETGSPA